MCTSYVLLGFVYCLQNVARFISNLISRTIKSETRDGTKTQERRGGGGKGEEHVRAVGVKIQPTKTNGSVTPEIFRG